MNQPMKGTPDGRDLFLKAGGLTLVWLILAILWVAARGISATTQPSDGGHHDFFVTDWHAGADEFMTTVEGHALNNTGAMIRRAVIVYRIYDEQRAVVGTATGYLNTPLFPGQAWAFKAVGFFSVPGGKAGLGSLTYE
jgi:hypothetical protein